MGRGFRSVVVGDCEEFGVFKGSCTRRGLEVGFVGVDRECRRNCRALVRGF